MKILAIVSTLDLKYRLGCTPAWWQMLKALHELGHEVLAIPYLGRSVETLWWQARPNPWRLPGEVYYEIAKGIQLRQEAHASNLREAIIRTITSACTLPVWHRYLRRVVAHDGDIDAVMFFNIPLNQIKGIPKALGREFGASMVYYDGDMPTILPEFIGPRGFMFDYYQGADLSEYDVFFVNSEGVISNLEEKGARNVRALHYAADPELFKPLNIMKEYDFAFFGYGSQIREYWMRRMIAEPSLKLPNTFVVGGGGFRLPLGRAKISGDVPMSRFGGFSCKARVSLNITRESHTRVSASSTARLFELAALGCCIVSCPYLGLERWFEPNKEIVVLSENDKVCEVYSNLLDDGERINKLGKAARTRVLSDHTYQHRAQTVISSIHSSTR